MSKLGTRRRCVVIFTPWPFHPVGKRPCYTFNGDSMGPEQVWMFWRRESALTIGLSSPLLIHNVQYAVPARMVLLDVIKLTCLESVFTTVSLLVSLCCVCAQASPCVHIHTFFESVSCCKVFWVVGTVQLLLPCPYVYRKAAVVKRTILYSSRIRHCTVHPQQCYVCLSG